MSEPEPKPCAHCGRTLADHVRAVGAELMLLMASGGHVSTVPGVQTSVLICPRNVYVPEKS